ncbi:MAG: PAS domain-containing protein [Candidatus Margulisiibacteriota bacterium]|jgi:PAS domain S-box-containing protein
MSDSEKQMNVSEKELLQISDYLEDIWRFLPIPIVHVSPVGVITDAGRETSDFLGYPKDEIIGRRFVDFIGSEAEANGIMNEVLSNGQVKNREIKIRKKSGEMPPVIVNGLLRKDAEGKIVGFFVSLVDVTESKKAEEKLLKAEERYRNTLDSMMEGFQIIGFDWRYLYVNNVVAEQEKRAKEELIGKTMMEVYPGIEKTEMFEQLKRCMEERVPHRMENEFVYPDGRRGYYELSIQPMTDGIFVVSQDITVRFQAEQKLKEKMQELEEFHGLAVGRELRMIELEKEVDALLAAQGRAPKYDRI